MKYLLLLLAVLSSEAFGQAQPCYLTSSVTKCYKPVNVASGGTGLTAGTNGGILGYTATGTLASSALLTNHGVVLGQGASATPVATAAGTTGQLLVGVNSGDPSWSNTVGNATTFQGGIVLNTSNNTNLNVYEEYTGASTANTGAQTASTVLKVTKIGRLISVHVPSSQASCSGSNSYTYGETLPSRFWPAVETEFAAPIYDATAAQLQPGGIFATTNGHIQVYRLITAGAGNFSGTCGLLDNMTITFYQ